MLKYRFIVPLKRGTRHPPEYTARGVAIGLAWAFTPLIGIQMPIVVATWFITNRLFNWNFSIIVALAWTWATNVATMIPIYYIFYVTGQFILGSDNIAGFKGFSDAWQATFAEGLAWYERVGLGLDVAAGFGIDLLVGSMPYVIASSWIGYSWSKAFITRYRQARKASLARKREQRRLRREKMDLEKTGLEKTSLEKTSLEKAGPFEKGRKKTGRGKSGGKGATNTSPA